MKVVKEAFQKLNDLVVPTMGAKGRLAIIEQDMDRPLLTDDGVTVARESRQLFTQHEKLPAISAIEAAANTEAEAYDGTTLTILLTNELYKLGLRWIKPKHLGGKGLHPQQAADKLMTDIRAVRMALREVRWDASDEDIKSVATISTKMPLVGDLVSKAYAKAGSDMNVLIEHDRENTESSIEHIDGMVLESGYFAEVMKELCNRGNTTHFNKAKIALLSSDVMTYNDVTNFFNSIEEGDRGVPIVFVVTRKFNPESLQILLTTLTNNKFTFQLIFVNEDASDELFLDLAAKTGGKIQDAVLDTANYLYEHCGTVDRIVIEQSKTTIIAKGDVTSRVQSYTDELKDKKYSSQRRREMLIRRRISSLTNGITTIKISTATITEFNILRLKLDDAIGAVKKSLEHGVVLGGGKALYNLSYQAHEDSLNRRVFRDLRPVLESPLKQILFNAGLRVPMKLKYLPQKYFTVGVDVTTGNLVDLHVQGIVDSFSSIDSALKNSVSIASNYLRAYTTIMKN